MKTNVSYKRLKEINGSALQYLIAKDFAKLTPQGTIQYTDKANTKLSSALKNIVKQIGKHFEVLNDELDNLRIANCLTDEKTKAILTEPSGAYKYTPDGMKKLKAEIKELESTEVEIHARLVDNNEDLNEDEIECFAGVVTNIVSE